MQFADEVRDPAGELDQLPIRTKVTGKDLDMAVSFVEAMTSPWKPTNYRGTYTESSAKKTAGKKSAAKKCTSKKSTAKKSAAKKSSRRSSQRKAS